MKKNLAITINQDLVLQVFGEYVGHMEHRLEDFEHFHIEQMYLYKGTLLEYTDYLDGLASKYKRGLADSIWEEIEQLCLDNIKENQ